LRVERTNRVRRRIASNFIPNATICDILRHPAPDQPPAARTANPTRRNGANARSHPKRMIKFGTGKRNRISADGDLQPNEQLISIYDPTRRL